MCRLGAVLTDMARLLLPIVLMLSVFATPVAAGLQTDPRTYCAGIFQSYESQLRCVQRENAARDRIARRQGSFHSQIDADIWNYCASVFDSWESVERCLGREEQAKRQLR